MLSYRKGSPSMPAHAEPVFFRARPGESSHLPPGWLVKALLILGAGFWIFSPALTGGWIWDDSRYISDNSIIQDPLGFLKVWVNPDGQGNYYPLTSFVQWFQWQWWGDSTLGYHLTNVVLHLASAFLIWLLFARLGLRLAWLGAFLFTVHPVMIESVAWISELKNTLSLPPLLLTLLAWLTWTETGDRRSYFTALTLFVVAMLAKTSGVMLPVIFLGYAWYRRGRIDKADLRAVAPFFFVALIAGIVTLIPHSGPEGDEIQKSWHLLPACASVGWSILFLLGKCVFPFYLQPCYEGFAILKPTARDFIPWLVLAGVGYGLWRNRAGWGRYFLLGLGFFLVNLIPVIIQVFVSYSIMVWSMEHLVYIPIIGLIGLAVVGLGLLDQRLSRPGRAAQWGLVSAAAAIMAWSGHAYAGWFADPMVFWNNLIREDPQNWTGELNLAMIDIKQKRDPDALVHLQKVLLLQPDLDDGHYGYGLALDHLGRLPEAEVEFRRALAINPRYVKSYLGLGYIQKEEGHLAEAEKLMEKGLDLEPRDVPLLIDTAGLLDQTGQVSEALALYQRAADLNPDIAQLQFDLGKTLLQQGDFSGAADHLARALDLDSNLAPAHGDLGVIFAHAGHLPEALDQFQTALQIDPNAVDVRLNFALALVQAGRIPDAIVQFEQVLQLEPNNAKARDSLAKLQQYQSQHGAPHARN